MGKTRCSGTAVQDTVLKVVERVAPAVSSRSHQLAEAWMDERASEAIAMSRYGSVKGQGKPCEYSQKPNARVRLRHPTLTISTDLHNPG